MKRNYIGLSLQVLLTLLLSTVMASRTVAAGQGWQQSYKAGYTDRNGRYCGGSEIMHIVSHQGRLFAFNGYWEDARWSEKTGMERQSAQVLRLDSPDAAWEVDLETGGTGLPHMKGNILKSVTFTTDKTGKPINKTLLIAASQTQPTPESNAISVFTRNDLTGGWHHTLLQEGPRRITCNGCKEGSRGVRRVPRDMEIYRDPVTGVDRIFLLIGDPGILSGVYNAARGRVEWDSAPEHPREGAPFPARPLGIAEANGRLYFSVGGSLYQRINGARPSWKEVWKISGDVNTDAGGIRGLTAIASPTGAGQSLIFVWTPGAGSIGEIKRLDGPELKEANETTLRTLFNDTPIGFHGDAEAQFSLGGYNRFFPVVNPNSGEQVHLVGYEQTISGAHEALSWHGYYRGATYSIRHRNLTYTSKEVNDRWVCAKPDLVAPRAFAHSPFPEERDVIYIGGFDANFNLSNDKAWIFKADVHTVLGISRGQNISSRELVCSYTFNQLENNRVEDGSGKGLTGTIHGKVTRGEGISGKAAVFNGADSYIRVPNSDLINMAAETRQRSIALWFKTAELPDSKVQIIFESGGDSRGVSIYIKGDQLFAGGWNTIEEESRWQGTFISPGPNSVKTDTWYHVVLTLEGDEQVKPGALKLYLDGQLTATGSGSQLWVHQGATAIGAFKGRTRVAEEAFKVDSGGYFKGAVDELQIYNTVLTATEIKTYFQKMR